LGRVYFKFRALHYLLHLYSAASIEALAPCPPRGAKFEDFTLGKRRKSRELALQVLYQIDMSEGDAEEKFNLFWQHFTPSDELKAFSQKIVEGVCQHREEIDALIEKHSEHWRLTRMTIVDRNVLRSAIFELMYCADIPTKVILNEAVELGKKFGSEKTGPFINGILDKVSHQIKRLQTTENN